MKNELAILDLRAQLKEAKERLEGLQRAAEQMSTSGASQASALLLQQAAREAERVHSLERRLATLDLSGRRSAAYSILGAVEVPVPEELVPHIPVNPKLLRTDTADVDAVRERIRDEVATMERALALRRLVLQALESVDAAELDASAINGLMVYFEPESRTLRMRPVVRRSAAKEVSGKFKRRSRRSGHYTRIYRITGAPAQWVHLIGAVVGPVENATYRSWRHFLEVEDPEYFTELEEGRLRGANFSAALYAQKRFGISYEVLNHE